MFSNAGLKSSKLLMPKKENLLWIWELSANVPNRFFFNYHIKSKTKHFRLKGTRQRHSKTFGGALKYYERLLYVFGKTLA